VIRGATPVRHLPGTADEIRARVSAVLEAYEFTRDNVLRAGVAPNDLKELCFRHLAGAGAARDLAGRSERERVALDWTDAIAYDSDRADDDRHGSDHGSHDDSATTDYDQRRTDHHHRTGDDYGDDVATYE